MEQTFEVTSHIAAGTHVRQYADALAHETEASLRLHVCKYRPRRSSRPAPDAPSFVFFPANGCSKELYEPFILELDMALISREISPRAYWIADSAYQGESALLNRGLLGDDPHWFDHSRDMLLVIHQFRDDMPQPLIAIGHSMGADQAAYLSSIHPRIFAQLVLLDPSACLSWSKTLPKMIKSIIGQPDTYDDMKAAATSIRQSPLFRTWDARVQQRYLQTAFFQPHANSAKVEKKTSKHAEMRAIIRPNLECAAWDQHCSPHERQTHPDLDAESPIKAPFYLPGIRETYRILPVVRPPLLYVLGQGSMILSDEEIDERLRITGTGVGGNGGIETGKVEQLRVPGGHFIPLTNPSGTAQAVAAWLSPRLYEWTTDVSMWRDRRTKQPIGEIQKSSAQVMIAYQTWDGVPWTKHRL